MIMMTITMTIPIPIPIRLRLFGRRFGCDDALRSTSMLMISSTRHGSIIKIVVIVQILQTIATASPYIRQSTVHNTTNIPNYTNEHCRTGPRFGVYKTKEVGFFINKILHDFFYRSHVLPHVVPGQQSEWLAGYMEVVCQSAMDI